jgi:translation initiation factor 4A
MSTQVEESAPLQEKETLDESSDQIIQSWDDFDLKTDLLRGIFTYGFEKPSPIQRRAIRPIIVGRDVIAQAQSGTGKTGAFTVSLLQRIDTSMPTTQAIVMAPTHELVNQIAKVVESIGSTMPDLRISTLVGGTPVMEDCSRLKNQVPHVIVGTAGRIYDMMHRRAIQPQDIRMFILDEADEMLSRGFKEQVYNIFQYFNNSIQVVLFSATMPPEILQMSSKFMRNPVTITMQAEELNLEGIEQYFIALEDDTAKYNMLKQLFGFLSISQCIIYVNSVKRVADLYVSMQKEGYSVGCIHSSMTKMDRDAAFNAFSRGEYRVLISSNVTARGIDIQQVSVVINFDIPNCVHAYLHRIGRSGRWGRKGQAINFITQRDVSMLRTIEQHYKSTITEFSLEKIN